MHYNSPSFRRSNNVVAEVSGVLKKQVIGHLRPPGARRPDVALHLYIFSPSMPFWHVSDPLTTTTDTMHLGSHRQYLTLEELFFEID